MKSAGLNPQKIISFLEDYEATKRIAAGFSDEEAKSSITLEDIEREMTDRAKKQEDEEPEPVEEEEEKEKEVPPHIILVKEVNCTFFYTNCCLCDYKYYYFLLIKNIFLAKSSFISIFMEKVIDALYEL